MKLIGLSGKARSGKDTVANHLWLHHEFTRIAFADPLKQGVKAMFGLTYDQTFDDALKEVMIEHWGMTPRRMFQLMGTEAIRNTFGQDVWCKRFMLSYDLLKDTDNVVVPDVRFDNEAELIRSLGGVIVEIRRGTGLAGEAGAHISEAGLSEAPEIVINNDSTLENLGLVTDQLVAVLK